MMMQTVCIANDEWHIEADFHHGNVGDVTLYRNTNVHVRGTPSNWEWYAAIPTANIKSYRMAGVLPSPSTKATPVEPQAEQQHGEPKAAPPKANTLATYADG